MTHPQFAEIRALLAQRNTNKAISRQLHVCPDTVASIRRELGLGNVPRQPLMLVEKWQRSTEPVTGGHRKWTGPLSKRGAPVLWFCRTSYTGARIAYYIHAGAWPVGLAEQTCDFPHCVAPAHQRDTAKPLGPKPVHPEFYGSAEAKLIAKSQAVPGGHTEWTGTWKDGRPVLLFDNQKYNPARLAFELRYVGGPLGNLTVECGFPHCLTLDHLDDDKSRQDYRRPTAILAGLLPSTDVCSRNHDLTTTEHARFYPDLRRYCGTCTKIRNSARTHAGASS